MEELINKIFLAIRKSKILFRFTLGLRLLLGIAFIPTGFIKVLGRRFTTGISQENLIGQFFEILYQSHYYWKFLGIAQILAAILILWNRTLSLGAIVFFSISLNILLITISFDFGMTILVAIGLNLAAVWLMLWTWNKLRFLLIEKPSRNLIFSEEVLSGKFEKGIYFLGFVSGLLVFSVIRGLHLPFEILSISLVCMGISFITAIILALKNLK